MRLGLLAAAAAMALLSAPAFAENGSNDGGRAGADPHGGGSTGGWHGTTFNYFQGGSTWHGSVSGGHTGSEAGGYSGGGGGTGGNY